MYETVRDGPQPMLEDFHPPVWKSPRPRSNLQSSMDREWLLDVKQTRLITATPSKSPKPLLLDT